MLKLCVYLIIFCVGQCCGIIYHLNETEYERLPRLFELENYEKCMEDAGGIYCVAHLELYTQAKSDLYTLIQFMPSVISEKPWTINRATLRRVCKELRLQSHLHVSITLAATSFRPEHSNAAWRQKQAWKSTSPDELFDKKLYYCYNEYSEYTLKHYNYSKIDRGICVTRTCESYARSAGLDVNRDLRAVLEGCLNQTTINKYDLMARVYGMNCQKEKEKAQLKLDYLDYIFLGVFIILVVLALTGSCFDSYSKDSDEKRKKGVSGRDFLLCFSIPENYKRLTTVEQKDARLDIFKCVHGFRTIVTFAVLYAHTVLLIASGFTSDPHSFEKAYESVTLRLTFSGLNVVQIFFFITGMLLSYFMQVAAETHNMSWKMIPNIVFYRWWRLTPSAAMLVAFSATWMRHLGSGPLWNTCVTNGTSGQCRRFFWAHLFYFNNYIAEDTLCSLQTWYIAADMQVFVIGVIIHFAISNRSTSFKVKSLTSLLLLSMAGPALQVWWQDIDAFAMQKPELYRTVSDANLRNLHVLGHNNLSASIIGLAAGYLIYYMQKNKVEYPNFKIGKFFSWFTIPTYLFLLYCGSLFYHEGERPSLALRVLYAGTNQAAIGFICAYVIIAVTLKFNAFTKAIMEHTSWVIPSRLSFCVYLLHLIFIDFGLGSRTQLTPVSFFNTFFISLGVLVSTYAIAVPFHLLIEAPTARLMKLSTTIDEKTDKKLK